MGAEFPVVLVDDGELDDIRDLLLDLGVEFAHLRGGAVPRRLAPPRDLFVTTLRHASLARTWPSSADGTHRPVRVAIALEDSNSARTLLRRLGFTYLVRRPVHPVALRLLLLRSLYTGTERRSEPRVPVGVDVSLRTGLRRREALLADLSRGGCRLLTEKAFPGGARVTVHLGEEATGEEALALGGRVVACERDASVLFRGGYGVSVRFETLGAKEQRRLERVLTRRSSALAEDEAPAAPIPHPALARAAEEATATPPTSHVAEAAPPEARTETLGESAPAPSVPTPAAPQPASEAWAAPDDGGPAGAPAPPTSTRPSDPDQLAAAAAAARAALGLPPPRSSRARSAEAGRATGSEAHEGRAGARLGAALLGRARRRAPRSERRRNARGHYDRKVVAAASDAMHRMLFGRELSAGGMRVDPHPGLAVGTRLRLAVYDPSGAAPVVVDAVVARDDGASGFALRFEAVDAARAARLEAVVAALPPVERLLEGETGAVGDVLTERLS